MSVVLPQPYTSNIYLSDVAVDDFLVIVVDNKWWIGRALEIDNDGDVCVSKSNQRAYILSMTTKSKNWKM